MLGDNDKMVVAIEAGVQEADRGDVLDFDAVKAELAAKMAALRASGERACRRIADDLTPLRVAHKMRRDGGFR